MKDQNGSPHIPSPYQGIAKVGYTSIEFEDEGKMLTTFVGTDVRLRFSEDSGKWKKGIEYISEGAFIGTTGTQFQNIWNPVSNKTEYLGVFEQIALTRDGVLDTTPGPDFPSDG